MLRAKSGLPKLVFEKRNFIRINENSSEFFQNVFQTPHRQLLMQLADGKGPLAKLVSVTLSSPFIARLNSLTEGSEQNIVVPQVVGSKSVLMQPQGSKDLTTWRYYHTFFEQDIGFLGDQICLDKELDPNGGETGFYKATRWAHNLDKFREDEKDLDSVFVFCLTPNKAKSFRDLVSYCTTQWVDQAGFSNWGYIVSKIDQKPLPFGHKRKFQIHKLSDCINGLLNFTKCPVLKDGSWRQGSSFEPFDGKQIKNEEQMIVQLQKLAKSSGVSFQVLSFVGKYVQKSRTVNQGQDTFVGDDYSYVWRFHQGSPQTFVSRHSQPNMSLRASEHLLSTTSSDSQNKKKNSSQSIDIPCQLSQIDYLSQYFNGSVVWFMDKQYSLNLKDSTTMRPGSGKDTVFRQNISSVETLLYKFLITQISLGFGVEIKKVLVVPAMYVQLTNNVVRLLQKQLKISIDLKIVTYQELERVDDAEYCLLQPFQRTPFTKRKTGATYIQRHCSWILSSMYQSQDRPFCFQLVCKRLRSDIRYKGPGDITASYNLKKKQKVGTSLKSAQFHNCFVTPVRVQMAISPSGTAQYNVKVGRKKRFVRFTNTKEIHFSQQSAQFYIQQGYMDCYGEFSNKKQITLTEEIHHDLEMSTLTLEGTLNQDGFNKQTNNTINRHAQQIVNRHKFSLKSKERLVLKLTKDVLIREVLNNIVSSRFLTKDEYCPLKNKRNKKCGIDQLCQQLNFQYK